MDIAHELFLGSESSSTFQLADFLSIPPFAHPFDIIVGNPPFSDSSKKGCGRKKLYETILLKCIDHSWLAAEDGFLCFVTPDNLFSGSSSTAYKELVKREIQHLSFKDDTYFPTIQQPICYFSVRNNLNCSDCETKIENSVGDKFSLVLEARPVNPIRNWSLATEQLTRQYVSTKRNSVKYNRGKPLSKYLLTPPPATTVSLYYRLIYTPGKKIYTDDIKLAVAFNVPKVVVFAISTKLEFEVDYTGQYGVGPNIFFFPIASSKEGDCIAAFLRSLEYRTLAYATKTTRQFLKTNFMEYLNMQTILSIE